MLITFGADGVSTIEDAKLGVSVQFINKNAFFMMEEYKPLVMKRVVDSPKETTTKKMPFHTLRLA